MLAMLLIGCVTVQCPECNAEPPNVSLHTTLQAPPAQKPAAAEAPTVPGPTPTPLSLEQKTEKTLERFKAIDKAIKK
jgi:hypothetical protein